MSRASGLGRLGEIPRIALAHTPTPLEALKNLSTRIGSAQLYVKRDDCTGLAFGGNKVRQLEYYLGEALARSADTVLITGAVQSNFVRLAAAAARKLGLDCHLQLEQRVPKMDPIYGSSGNVLVNRLLGATLYSYPDGEDEAGADRRLAEIGAELELRGRSPYIIPLGPGHAPLGALGYVQAACEILEQLTAMDLTIDEVVVASGSGYTHAGLLFGFRAMESEILVTGVCVRREVAAQTERIREHCRGIASLLGVDSAVEDADIRLLGTFLGPGYGVLNASVIEALEWAARDEGLILDPVYTAKAMAGCIERARDSSETQGRRLLFVHTGGQPALFAYERALTAAFKNDDEYGSRVVTERRAYED